jgi:hypothetical protein
MRLAFIGFIANSLIVVSAAAGIVAEQHANHWTASGCFVLAILFLIAALCVKARRTFYAGEDRG